MKSALAIIAKFPRNGHVKTRLCPPLTPNEATELYRAFLLDTIQLIAGMDDLTPYILYTPDDARDDFRALVPAHFDLVPQRGADLGERLANGLHDLLTMGYDAAAIMDSDSPTLPQAHIRALFEHLRDPRVDVAFGPCDDGGYWAVGMKQVHRAVFQHIAWSTNAVLQQTLQRAHEANLVAACAPVWYDVDDGETLTRLRVELNVSPSLHTKRVIEQLADG
jgi:hypothetical protein